MAGARSCMSTYRLDKLFSPQSVALAGASPRPKSLGATVLRNIREGGFAGRIDLVNPKHRQIEGIATVASLGELKEVPDLLVVTTPPATVPQLIAEAGAKGIPSAVVLSAGLGHGPGSLFETTRRVARQWGFPPLSRLATKSTSILRISWIILHWTGKHVPS